MPDLDELFKESTSRVEAEHGALARQHARQRRHRRGQRAAVFAIAAAIAVVFVAGFWALSAREDTGRPADDQSITPPQDSGPEGLFSVDVATGATGPRVIAHVSSVSPDISPDGERLAFVRTVNGNEQIFVSTIKGNDVTQVTGVTGSGRRSERPDCHCGATDPDWSPDGKTIAFSGTNIQGRRDLYTIELTTGAIRRLTTSLLLYESGPDWSHDGTRIVFTRGRYDRGITSLWVLDVASGRSQEVSVGVDGQQPAWSPDDATIAFVSADADGDGTDIWLVHADGSGARRLVDTARDDVSPAWSPDGSQIAFAAFHSDADPVMTQIVVVDATVQPDGRAPETRVLVDDLTDPTWDPVRDTIIGRRI